MPDYKQIAKLIRYYILLSSTTAGSGHATSSLSAADLLTVLYFNYFRYDFNDKNNLANDRLIFSKGHATPLLYSLYKVAGKITTEQLLQYRKQDSPLQGHPTPDTPFVDVATGSLGMGLSYGLGMALGLLRQSEHAGSASDNPNVYVLLGDGEMAEGQNWEALQLAAHYNTYNLIGILDVNRLAQTDATMLGHDVETYQKRISSFGWDTVVIDGHNFDQIDQAFNRLTTKQAKPTMIIAKTIKGKGVSFLEDQPNRHGKALKQVEFKQAIEELEISITETEQVFDIKKPSATVTPTQVGGNPQESNHSTMDSRTLKGIYDLRGNDSTLNVNAEPTPTRKAYGESLALLAKLHPEIIVMDADLSDSTFSGLVEKAEPTQFFNMYIAEQNMVSAAVGLSKLGYKPFVSTFSSFMTRAYDQIRMAALSQANLVLCGSHGGVSVGEDGPSGMGLEDIAMMRPIQDSTILYPSDQISMSSLVNQSYANPNITYLRSTRVPTSILYSPDDQFPIGGSKTLKSSPQDICAIIAAGITVHEALKAHAELEKEGISIRIIDLYSIKPIDQKTLHKAAQECQNKLITVEDHSIHGGLGDVVLEAFTGLSLPQVTKLGVKTRPHSATPSQNLDQHGLSAPRIVNLVRTLL